MKSGYGSFASLWTAGTMLLVLSAWTVGCDAPPKHDEEEDKAPKSRRKLDKPGDYLSAVVRGKTFAETRVCLMRLTNLKQELTIYAYTNDGKFPPSLAALKRDDLIHTPMRGNEEYSYVPGQTAESNAGNILVYLTEVDHAGKCHVLRVGGAVEAIDPDDLDEQLKRQGVSVPQ